MLRLLVNLVYVGTSRIMKFSIKTIRRTMSSLVLFVFFRVIPRRDYAILSECTKYIIFTRYMIEPVITLVKRENEYEVRDGVSLKYLKLINLVS